MNQLASMLALTLALGATGTQTAYAQQPKDPRVANLVQAGRLRVGVGLGTPAQAIKNPATGELRGPSIDLGRSLAARIGVDFVAVEYPRPGAVLEGVQTKSWDVAFTVTDPERAKQVDFSTPFMQSDSRIWRRLVPRSTRLRTRTSPGFALRCRAGTRQTSV